MHSTGRFLLGGALVAVLGYVLSKKNLQKTVLQGGRLSAGRVALPSAPGGMRTFQSEEAKTMAPAAAMVAEAPVIEAPAIRSSFIGAPVVEEPVREDSVVDEPLVEPVPVPWWESAAEPTAESPPAPVAEMPAAEVAEVSAVGTPVTEEAEPEEYSVEEAPAAAVMEPPEETTPSKAADIVWEAVSSPTLEAEPPVKEWEPAQVVAEEAPFVELPVEPAAAKSDSDVVVTGDFLEEPLPGSGWGATSVPVMEEALEDFLQVVPDEFPPMAAAEIDRPVVEDRDERPVPAWSESSPEVSETEVEEAGLVRGEEGYVEAPVAELSLAEEVMVETPVAEVADAEIPVVEAGLVDDLKSRIEETRRRIRRELEQPFISVAEVPAPEDDWTVAPAVAAPSEPEVLDDVDLGAEPEEPVDYDSIKSRIEVTRSRLKAKAFDAMMTGESALLGRDTEDAEHRKKVVPAVDSEVSETIESSLREEEN